LDDQDLVEIHVWELFPEQLLFLVAERAKRVDDQALQLFLAPVRHIRNVAEFLEAFRLDHDGKAVDSRQVCVLRYLVEPAVLLGKFVDLLHKRMRGRDDRIEAMSQPGVRVRPAFASAPIGLVLADRTVVAGNMGADANVGIWRACAVLQAGEINLDRLGGSIAAGGTLPPALARRAHAKGGKEGGGSGFLLAGLVSL